MYWIVALIFVMIVIFILFSSYPPIGNGRRYVPSGRLNDRLRTKSILEPGDGRRTFCDASLERRSGLYVLRLKGAPYEMGFQHGVLLREEIRRGALLYHAGSVDNFAPFNQKSDFVRWLLKKYFDWTIYRPLFRNAPKDYLTEIKGLADGCGLPFDVVFRGNMLSEFNMNTAKLTKQAMLKRLQSGECTSFAAFGSNTPDGKVIMGRNTDYSGAGLWDKYQTVMFYEPQDGHRFVNVGTAGLLKCNSCMNEKGLCLGGHFLYSDDVKANGVGFTALELEIMKKSGSIEQAYAIVRKYARAGAFGYLLVDGRRNEAAVVEACANHVGLRLSEKERICETNFMTTTELKPVDILIKHGVGRNPLARYRRMLELIDENPGSITPQKAAMFMGDHKDLCSNSVRPFGMCPATLANLTSAVFHPECFDFWVADGL
ncbi:MAG: C45 family peptidase, partial [Anaerolineaceae bacterium]|nr:C45 family peptidase [Anaerolineaceae bacterium]